VAAAIFIITVAGLALSIGAFLLGLRIGKGVEVTRKREVKAARLQLAVVCGQLGRVETLALDNSDGIVLSTQILKITRTNPEG
jgi:hypothetical protein